MKAAGRTLSRLLFGAPRLQLALPVPLLAYCALEAFPQLVFRQHVDVGSISVYSRSIVRPEIVDRVREALRLAAASDIAMADRKERIFLCNANWLYRVFSPLSGSSFALSMPVTDNIFVVQCDVARNIACSSAPLYNQRSLSSVMAHEITHGLIRHSLGPARTLFLPRG